MPTNLLLVTRPSLHALPNANSSSSAFLHSEWQYYTPPEAWVRCDPPAISGDLPSPSFFFCHQTSGHGSPIAMQTEFSPNQASVWSSRLAWTQHVADLARAYVVTRLGHFLSEFCARRGIGTTMAKRGKRVCSLLRPFTSSNTWPHPDFPILSGLSHTRNDTLPLEVTTRDSTRFFTGRD